MTPISYFEDIRQRCAEIEALHGYLAGRLTSAISADELLRAEWVGHVSALDLYMHELVAQNMIKIFEGTRGKCLGFSKFQCSSETLLRIRNACTNMEANAAFDLEVRNKLSRVTYQYPDDIADGIRLISDCELWNEVALFQGATASTKITDAKMLKKSLTLIVARRNKIVHEGDLQPTVPRLPWAISRADVSFAGNFIDSIVRAIDGIV
jgi:hypothetical protein